jgi:hypothetical protein
MPAAPQQAVINRYGAWEVDDAPPVLVEVREVDGSSNQGSSRVHAGEADAPSAPKVSAVCISITGK